MAASFAQFGRIPEGPPSEIDIAELVSYTARSIVPESMKLELEIERSLEAGCAHLTDRLIARGDSAGGLLIGAVANLAPAAFGAWVRVAIG